MRVEATSVYFVFSALLASSIFASIPITHYECSYCLSVTDYVLQSSNSEVVSLVKDCKAAFPSVEYDVCSEVFPANKEIPIVNRHSRKTCASAGFCPSEPEPWEIAKVEASNGLDVRVSKALGSRGYDKIRLSVISNHTIDSSYFSYGSPFKYRWTSNSLIGNTYLNSGIVTVKPGEKTTLVIEGKEVVVSIPKDGEGVRGVIIADPCFTSQYIVCAFQKQFNTFTRMTELLNAIMEFDDAHYFQILGDNFYDQDGGPTATFYAALSDKTKSRVMAAVPGNHDFWINSNPGLWVPKDQQGQGFMQFYGQDVMASASSDTAAPYDLSVDPDGANKGRNNLPAASNFMFYNKVGNTAFIGFSGAHSLESQLDYFNEACTWANAANPDVVLLLGHWDVEGLGCPAEMSTPALYSELLALPTCSGLAGKMKYFMGHKHCNHVTEPDIGFMVGALGMSDSNCGGLFGFPVVDTTGGSFKVYYFPINDIVKNIDNYDSILNCVRAGGISNCYHLATVWSSKEF